MPGSALYEKDFYAWANQQAALLRAGDLSAADIAHIAEEIESMGKTEKRELVSRLIVLLKHLLKWQFQPKKRGASWEATIIVQRSAIEQHFEDNPSLVATADVAISRAYRDAMVEAAAETKLSKKTFPTVCPWSLEQITDETFWPA